VQFQYAAISLPTKLSLLHAPVVVAAAEAENSHGPVVEVYDHQVAEPLGPFDFEERPGHDGAILSQGLKNSQGPEQEQNG
jgi:hypothetical protein